MFIYVGLIQIYQKEKREKHGNQETKQRPLDTGEHGTESSFALSVFSGLPCHSECCLEEN